MKDSCCVLLRFCFSEKFQGFRSPVCYIIKDSVRSLAVDGQNLLKAGTLNLLLATLRKHNGDANDNATKQKA